MSKYLRRLAAKSALSTLRESAKEGKSWIVSKKLILETEDEDLELEVGDTVEVGANPEGDMVIDGQAAVVVITDADLAAKIADIIVSADEMSDVKFVEKPALDAVLDGEEVDDVVDKLGDDENDEVEVAEVDIDAKESVEAKFAKFSANRMNPERYAVCESILVDEDAKDSLNLAVIKKPGVRKESFTDYSKFAARVSEVKGSLQPGNREIALSESGKVIGSFNKEASNGMLFLENEFDSVEAMDEFDPEPADVIEDIDLGKPIDLNTKIREELGEDRVEKMRANLEANGIYSAEDVNNYRVDAINVEMRGMLSIDDVANAVVDEYGVPYVAYAVLEDTLDSEIATEACLKRYEESAKTGADYAQLVKGLRHLNESVAAKIVSTFDNAKMTNCVRVFDTKLGKYVAAFKESANADNFIEETKDAKRFTKRFFV